MGRNEDTHRDLAPKKLPEVADKPPSAVAENRLLEFAESGNSGAPVEDCELLVALDWLLLLEEALLADDTLLLDDDALLADDWLLDELL